MKEWRFIDKSEWGPGSWQDEPDKVVWTDEPTGLVCMIHRHPRHGHLCGYVAVTEGHPAFNRCPEEIPVDGYRGLNYAAFCETTGTEYGICHIPEPGAPDRVWWLGFDCGHLFDLSPGCRATLRRCGVADREYPGFREVYRDIAFVQAWCTRLAAQLQQLRDDTLVPSNFSM